MGFRSTTGDKSAQYKFLRSTGRRLRPSVLAGLSQFFGLIQIWLLLRGLGGGLESDAYFYLSNWSLLPIQIVLLGVLYPLWLRGRKISVRNEALVVCAVALLSALFCAAGALVLSLLGNTYPGVWSHIVLLALAGVVLTICWAGALRASSIGNADWLSSVTLLPSVAACILLLVVPTDDLSTRVTGMCWGMLLGSLLYLLMLVVKAPALFYGGLNASSPTQGAEVQGNSGTSWFSVKSVSGYGSGIILQSVAATLPPSGLTLVGILTKIVGGFSTVVTNTILPRVVHKGSDSAAGVFRYGWILICFLGALMLMVGAAATLWGSYYIYLSLVVLGWILAAAISASLQRVAMRFHSPSLSLISIILSILVPLVSLVAAATVGMDLKFILIAYVTIEFSIAVAMAIVLRKYVLGAAFCVVCVAGTMWGTFGAFG